MMYLQFFDPTAIASVLYVVSVVCVLLVGCCYACGSNPGFASGKKVVIYARYSSDKQRETSIDDQIRNVRNHLDKLGIPHRDALVLYDKEVSGEREDRENYQKIRAMLRNGEISVLACDEVSRFTRGPAMGVVADEMEIYNCRFVTADGYDSDHDHYGLMATIQGKMAGIANRELAYRIRRGIAGRTLDRNGADGTHPFGYSTRYCNPEEALNYRGIGPKPTREVFINEAESKIVREIFTLYADGMSQSEIARNLNGRNIPLGAQSNRRDQNGGTYQNGWHKGLISKLLRQRKYIGLWVWGEFNHRKTPTGKRIARRSNPCDIARSERPDLAIVPLDMWDAVQERLKRNRDKYGFEEGQKRRGARTHYSNEYPSNMLSGLLFCGECGSRMHFAGKNPETIYYRCPIAHRNGKADGVTQCSQHGFVPYNRAVAALTDYLHRECLNSSAWVEEAYSAAVAAFRRLDSRIPEELADVEAKLEDAVKAINNMVALVEKGVASDSLAERLTAREAEKRELESTKIRLGRRKNRQSDLPTLAWVKEQVANLPGVLAEDPRKAALFFRKFFKKVSAFIVVGPGKKRGHAEIEFKVNRFGAVREAICRDSAYPLEMDGEGAMVAEGDVVRIALAGNDKLDNLMPTIDAMIQAGKTWRQIEAELRINRGWANRYYRIWKSAAANKCG
jgi:DNA invertase Pin-like site-specific DNA recombinase